MRRRGLAGTSFVAACENGTLPNVCYIDPAFDNESDGTAGDDHPLGDIRLGERFIADAYHALADNGFLASRFPGRHRAQVEHRQGNGEAAGHDRKIARTALMQQPPPSMRYQGHTRICHAAPRTGQVP